MRILSNILIGVTLLCVQAGAAMAQSIQRQNVEIIADKYKELVATVQRLDARRDEISKQLQAKSGAIEQLKSQGKLNYLERQRLESLLQQSQDLSFQFSESEKELEQIRTEMADVGRELVREYDAEVARLLKQLDKESASTTEGKRAYQRLAEVRTLRDEVQKQIGEDDLDDLTIYRVELNPNDTPRQIRQKADLLRDQEDKQRLLSEQFRQKRGELQKELNLRNRIDDLMTDLALFDQQQEAVGNLEQSAVTPNEPQSSLIDESAAPARNSNSQTSFLFSQPDFDFSKVSGDQLETLLLELEKRETLSKVRADSLAKEAAKFDKAAEEFKKR